MTTYSSTSLLCAPRSSPSVELCLGGLAQWKGTTAPQFSKMPSFRTLQLNNKRTGGRQYQPTNLSISAAMEVPDFLPATWTKRPTARPIGPSFELTAEDTTLRQLEALQINDQPYPDHGVEVMYRFAGFDPFQRSTYFGPTFDLGQFERFRRIFHHSTYRVLLCHTEREILSSLYLDEHCFKQRVGIIGARPGEEEIFEFTLIQRVGGNWDGYWLTDSLRHDGKGITGSIAY